MAFIAENHVVSTTIQAAFRITAATKLVVDPIK